MFVYNSMIWLVLACAKSKLALLYLLVSVGYTIFASFSTGLHILPLFLRGMAVRKDYNGQNLNFAADSVGPICSCCAWLGSLQWMGAPGKNSPTFAGKKDRVFKQSKVVTMGNTDFYLPLSACHQTFWRVSVIVGASLWGLLNAAAISAIAHQYFNIKSCSSTGPRSRMEAGSP